MKRLIQHIMVLGLFFSAADLLSEEYPWAHRSPITRRIGAIAPPRGFIREKPARGAFAWWLRNLPLKPRGSKVYLHNGRLKKNQRAHYAVIDIDTGGRDLQQCADAVMRLRAEYLYSQKRYESIRFNFTDGIPARYSLYRLGYRPVIRHRRKTRWRRRAAADFSYKKFRKYMTLVFSYAGTYSLSKELKRISPRNLRSGDVYIKGGFPGHAVIVVDRAVHPGTGKAAYLLAQSFMPAQDMHILRNPGSSAPWYFVDNKPKLITPEWEFRKRDLKRFSLR